MANRLTKLNLCNQALRRLGDEPVTTLAVTNQRRVNIFNEHADTLLDQLLEAHLWNFATVRTAIAPFQTPATSITPAATTGTGILFTTTNTGIFGLDAVGQTILGVAVPGTATITGLVTNLPAASLTPAAGALTPGAVGVVFTANASVFGAGDVGKLIENLGGVGVARVTAFTATTLTATILTAWEVTTPMPSSGWRLVRTDQVTADIGQAFAAGAIPSGSWRLYNARPEWGFGFKLNLPPDMIRPGRMRRGRVYQQEGNFIVSNYERMEWTYIRRVTDITTWPAYFVNAYVAAMVALMAEPVTGQRTKQVDWTQLAEAALKKAKMLDGSAGSPPILRSYDLANARMGGGPIYTTEE